MKKAPKPKKPTPRDLIEEQLTEENPKALFADGFDDALIGIARRANGDALAAYSREKCVKVLMDRDGMDERTPMSFSSSTSSAHGSAKGRQSSWIRNCRQKLFRTAF
jgi:hypothetical protein